MTQYEELEKKVEEYMLMEDKGILRLLCAFCIGCKLPLPPPWVFLVSSSSGGKTKLIQLLELVPGYFEIDDLTANTLLSGMKKHDSPPSLLHRLDVNSFIVFKDFTTILSKYKEQMAVLMGQLRMVYDGKMSKHTGMGDELLWNPIKAPGLIAGVTTKIYTTSRDWADMGERMIMYHMEQPDNMDVGRWIITKKRDERALENDLKDTLANYLASVVVPTDVKELPDMDLETQADLVEIAFLTVQSRSPIERTESGYKKKMALKHDHEMIGRFLKQLINLGYALMLMNPDHKLSALDRRILYKIGLDSIPMQRFMVMKALTANRLGGDVKQIAEHLHYPEDTVEEWVEDLTALGIIKTMTHFIGGTGRKKTYHIEDRYMTIISKFEGIKPEDKELPPSEDDKEAAEVMDRPAPVESPPDLSGLPQGTQDALLDFLDTEPKE